ncbi:hypothetical protein MANES_07G059800v8 [Manihot esculenta]|uniref:Uncharacterized protein n=1 Tax=Manihot esculenta TaxID=3983 RepID=A0ACB7HFN1_MANES|nr:hypothetical protein MANES_07G059800v8 [Manihot esculenta]
MGHSSFLLSIIYFLCFSFLVFATHRSNDTDRLALLQLKAKIIHDPFGIMGAWNSTLHFCQWYGVRCGRKHQRVTIVNLSSLELSGSISPYVGNLSFLKKLFLYNNSFNGEIPTEIGHLRRLQNLYLHNNSIGGRIPASISNCSNLGYFTSYNNNLVGRIPARIGSLLKLKAIAVAGNHLTGDLPPSLGNLSSLQEINVQENNFHVSFPDALCKLMNLRILDLSINQFLGTIPPSFLNLSLIEVIDISINSLEGSLPLNLGNSFPNLQFFSIVGNHFSGSIPMSISNASSLELFQLNENNFTGRVPSLQKLHRLMRLTIAGNNLGSGKADDLEFLSTLSNATNLQALIINENNFGGKLPEQLCSFSEKLQMIFIDENQIFGNIPTRNCVSLEILVANDNYLSGPIPSSIGKLINLGILYLKHNDLSGSIPSTIGNMTSLLQMDLSHNKLQGMIPPSLGNCKKLIRLDLSYNNLSGPMPPQLFGSSPLSIGLDLSRNQLSGSIPSEIGNLTNMGRLYLSKNVLSGVIPKDLSSCTSLEYLYMDANLFQGSVPSSLSSLRGLRELNLSHNLLSGNIPEFLEEFHTLKLLDLSYNNFEGATVLLICLLMRLSRKRKRDQSSSSFHGKELLKLSYQNLLKATNGFSSDNLIGTGSFGSVYKGILDPEGTIVAVKVFNLMCRGAIKSFVAECEALRNLRHRNLVKILTTCSGVNYQGDDFKALVYEFMVNGSLDSWLHPALGSDEVPRTLDILQRLNIGIDVACALEYLHLHCETPVVHSDLKPSNVLLDENMTGRLSDFGLVKFLSDGILGNSTDQSSSFGLRGTIGYCPPEYGVGSKTSTSGDIFSFGILLLEMFSGKRPTDEMFKENLSLHNFVKRALPEQVTEIIDPNLFQARFSVHHNDNLRNRRNDMFIECLISIFKIGLSCSAESPQERMNISDIVAQLSSIKNKFLGAQLPREREVADAFLLAGGQS